MSLVSPAPDVQSLTVPVAATLLGLGVAVAGLLTHSLRKARTDDWVVEGFAHAESGATEELVERIGRWAREALAVAAGADA